MDTVDDGAERHTGKCFCGAVEVAVTGDPLFEGYCHCTDCRAWSAAPVTAYGLWPASAVAVTAGEEHLVGFSRSGTTDRKHCGRCGALIMVDLGGAGMVDVFPLRLEGRAFQPKSHVHYIERIIDMADGLPKHADLPAVAGGSGKMIAE